MRRVAITTSGGCSQHRHHPIAFLRWLPPLQSPGAVIRRLQATVCYAMLCYAMQSRAALAVQQRQIDLLRRQITEATAAAATADVAAAAAATASFSHAAAAAEPAAIVAAAVTARATGRGTFDAVDVNGGGAIERVLAAQPRALWSSVHSPLPGGGVGGGGGGGGRHGPREGSLLGRGAPDCARGAHEDAALSCRVPSAFDHHSALAPPAHTFAAAHPPITAAAQPPAAAAAPVPPSPAPSWAFTSPALLPGASAVLGASVGQVPRAMSPGARQ